MSIDWNRILRETDHRPWPLPERPWVMTMSWLDLLLAHWPVDPELVAATLPDQLTVDTWEGDAWLSVVPFEMANTTARGLTWFPWKMRFAELNLRTYVTVDGDKPGVWFYSLDASSALAVTGARTFFHLPYYRADMRIDRDDASNAIDYESRRTHGGAPDGQFDATYRPTGPASVADPGSFDEWLVRRYCLYSSDDSGRVYRAGVHHRPWQLREVEADIRVNTLDTGYDFEMNGEPAAAHYADRLDVLGWWPERIETT
jgi:uncharacterized protein YqjF (DUF2071 family)